jgi:hypothetical protein
MTDTPPTVNEDDVAIISRFESIGDNCEFGFVQRKLGLEVGQLLRWAFIPTESLLAALRNEFNALYEFEKLIPAAHDMVWDQTYHISFHSHMRSEVLDGKLQFKLSEEEREKIHKEEIRKIMYLRHKFYNNMRAGGQFYVIKKNAGLSMEICSEIYKIIASVGENRLLAVVTAETPEQIGTVAPHADGFTIGYIDRLAPYNQADDVSLETWIKLCRAALEPAA